MTAPDPAVVELEAIKALERIVKSENAEGDYSIVLSALRQAGTPTVKDYLTVQSETADVEALKQEIVINAFRGRVRVPENSQLDTAFKRGVSFSVDELNRRGLLTKQPEGWRSIDSAPRDGTEILVACTLDNGKISVVCNARWLESNHAPYKEFWHDIEGAMAQDDVTLWCPLPPIAAAEDEK